MDGLIMAASMNGSPARHVAAVLGGMGEMLGRSAENALLISRERERARLLTHLADFGNFAVSSYEEEHLRKAATAALRSMFPQSAGYVTALDPGSGALKVAEVFGPDIERTELGSLLGSTECDEAAGCRAISRGGDVRGNGQWRAL